MNPKKVYLLGIISKTRGATGAVILKLIKEASSKFYELESVFLEIEGLLVPFFIKSSRSLDNKNIIINFDSVESVDQGKGLIHRKVYTEIPGIINKDNKEPDFSFLKGYTLWDNNLGYTGKISGILSYSQNTLLKVTKEKMEFTIPIHEDLIIEINSQKKLVVVDLPEGLLDL